MIIDGTALAEEILAETKALIAQSSLQPKLLVLQVGSNPASEQFIALKKRKAESVGITVQVFKLPTHTSTATVIDAISEAQRDASVHGIVLQLPLPDHIDTDTVLRVIPTNKDVDALNGELAHPVLPPVVAAIAEIVKRNDVELYGKNVLVVGKGRLVGQPAAEWFRSQGANVTAIDEHSISTQRLFIEADILVTGAGTPHLVKPIMIKEGVVIFDAGTSEDSGKLVGDVDPACDYKASLFTPVPGGIGPMTVALLLRNVATLTSKVVQA